MWAAARSSPDEGGNGARRRAQHGLQRPSARLDGWFPLWQSTMAARGRRLHVGGASPPCWCRARAHGLGKTERGLRAGCKARGRERDHTKGHHSQRRRQRSDRCPSEHHQSHVSRSPACPAMKVGMTREALDKRRLRCLHGSLWPTQHPRVRRADTHFPGFGRARSREMARPSPRPAFHRSDPVPALATGIRLWVGRATSDAPARQQAAMTAV
jgi:hypothetical protein